MNNSQLADVFAGLAALSCHWVGRRRHATACQLPLSARVPKNTERRPTNKVMVAGWAPRRRPLQRRDGPPRLSLRRPPRRAGPRYPSARGCCGCVEWWVPTPDSEGAGTATTAAQVLASSAVTSAHVSTCSVLSSASAPPGYRSPTLLQHCNKSSQLSQQPAPHEKRNQIFPVSNPVEIEKGGDDCPWY